MLKSKPFILATNSLLYTNDLINQIKSKIIQFNFLKNKYRKTGSRWNHIQFIMQMVALLENKQLMLHRLINQFNENQQKIFLISILPTQIFILK